MPASSANLSSERVLHGFLSSYEFSRAANATAALFVVCMIVSATATGQTSQAEKPTTVAAAQNPPGASQQVIPPVTTTVIVHGDVKDNYLSETITAGTLDGMVLRETPLSATVVTRDLLNDQASRLLSDVVKNDASVGEDYAPVGYYGDFEIRGFPIDLATGLEVNGMTIAGEQDVPLENKERVEFVKGIAGVESGVTSAGGLINYITKRPALIEALDLATDHRGSAFGDMDLGHFFGGQRQVGMRLNLAGERIQSYVKDADGWRAIGAGSTDWKITPRATLKGDFEYQHKVERSVAGYQLLGGTTVPDLHQIHPSTMLGEQSWSKPNTFDTHNASARFDYTIHSAWRAFAEASYSHSLIDDNVVWPYGCYNETDCSASGGSPPWYFAPDGTYDIYDYRNPGELRIDAEAEAMIMGHGKMGAIAQDVAAGGNMFRRSVQQPGFYTSDSPSSTTVADGAVYTYVGSENIYQPISAAPLESPVQSAGPRRLFEDNHQAALLLQDRIHLPGRIQLLAGGRYDSLHDHNYSLYASCLDFAVLGACGPVFTNKPVWLPQYAVTYNPIDNLTVYGNYNVMLSLGPQAPFWTDNGSQFLAPYFTRQGEIGAKYEPGRRILLSTALFRMRAPFFYPKALPGPDSFCRTGNAGDQCFESQGGETHYGVEVNAEGKAANWLRLTASGAAIRATSTETGTPAFDDKQVINVPRFRTAVFADVAVPHGRGLHVMPGWSYSGSKDATRDDAVRVPGYNLFNLGARYTVGGEQGRMTLRLYADNIADKRYWKDTGASYGDTFLHLGAPTTVRLSAHYTF